MLHKLSFSLLFAVLTCGQIASAQNTQSAKCSDVKLMEKFDWLHFEGVWYEYARYPTESKLADDCIYVNYTYIPKNNELGIKFSALNASNMPVSFDVTAQISGLGLFFVTLNGSSIKRTDKILGTDYKSWAVIYSCENVESGNAERAWILTRERTPDSDTVGKAEAIMNQNGVSTEILKNTRQNGCPAQIEKGNTKTNLLGSLKNWLLP